MQYINKNKYSCCQLISALNALLFFGKKVPDINSDAFDGLVNLVKCRYGSALNIEKVYSLFDLDVSMRYGIKNCSLGWIRNNLPVEVSVSHRKTGFHSILIVGVKGYRLEVTNFVKKYLLWSELKKSLVKHKKHQRFKSFKVMKVSNNKRKLNGIKNNIN